MKKITFIILAATFFLPSLTHAANITGTTAYAWSDVMGWINFNPTNGNVTVTNSAVTGYAWSAQYGWINLAPTNGGVVNDGNGNLSGSAWGANTGWIDFTGVSINSSGVFTGHTASSTLAGTITFSCANCLVTTSWRPGSAPASSSPVTTPSGGGSGSGGGSPVSGSLTPPENSIETYPGTPSAVTPSQNSTAESPTTISSNSNETYPYGGHAASATPTRSISSSFTTDVSSPTDQWWNTISIPLSAQVLGGISICLLIIVIIWRVVRGRVV